MYGGNVGSVARAMANFGLRRLVLVNPAPEVLSDPSLAPMARTAVELIRNATSVSTLEEALNGVEVALGFTTRTGKRRRDGIELRQAIERLGGELSGARVAAVFGREDRGLTNAELDLCHWLVRIPTHPDLTSLNLSQAVVLFAYELDQARRAGLPPNPTPRTVASVPEMEGFYAQLEELLVDIGFIEEKSPDRMMNELRRIFSRRLPEPRDVRILRGILSKVELALGAKARDG